MIILVFLGVVVLVWLTTLIPVFLPFTISYITYAVHIWISPWGALIWVSIASFSMWYVWYIYDRKIIDYLIKKYPWLRVSASQKHIGRLQKILQHKHATPLVWLCTVGWSFSSLPDVVLIRLVRSSLSLPWWTSSYTLWKLFLYGSFLYAIQWIMHYFS
jgi:hypothetical protein